MHQPLHQLEKLEIHRTNHDADKCEDEELRDHEEGEVSRDDCTVEARPGGSALIAGQPAHRDGQEVAERGRDRGRKHTRDNGKGNVTVVRPCVNEGHKGSDLPAQVSSANFQKMCIVQGSIPVPSSLGRIRLREGRC